MSPADGLAEWRDGSVAGSPLAPGKAVCVTQSMLMERHLWAVRPHDVVNACEDCAFGRLNPVGMIKHTNLTGGAPAFASGELLFLSDDEVIVNGKSRRYGPRDEVEMTSVAKAFKNSGYHVWSMGYDREAGVPYPFVGVRPEWVT